MLVLSGFAHRFFLVSVHASAAKRGRLRDASRRPRWLVWCYVLSDNQFDRRQDLQVLGAAKTSHLFAPEQTQRVRFVLVEQRLRAAKIRSPFAQTRRPAH